MSVVPLITSPVGVAASLLIGDGATAGPSRIPGRFIAQGRADQVIAAFLNQVFIDAANEGASDIHLSSQQNAVRVRYRLAGKLVERYRLANEHMEQIVRKIGSRADMLILDVDRKPLDGSFRFDAGEFWIDVRVSIIPTREGYTITARLLDSRNAGRPLESLYMADNVRSAFVEAIHASEGLMLCVGPTGQGKTTTLYSALAARNTPDSKVVTVEDPIEYSLAGAEQVNVQLPDRSFAAVLKAFLRQDFDVALVGEIRDAMTADIAITAANTGHLVMSTMHASDTLAAIRLLVTRYGVTPDNLASAVRAIVAQRLLPRLCPHCHETHSLSESDVERVKRATGRIAVSALFARLGTAERRSRCTHCDGRGTRGMIPVMELLSGSHAIIAAITTDGDLREAAYGQAQYTTLKEAALIMSAAGLVDLEHALAVG